MKKINEWAKALQTTLASKVDKVPPEWKTHKEIAKLLGLGAAQTTRVLATLRAEKKVECRKFKILYRNGTAHACTHYRLLP